jgi:uncharacterized protein (TIGR03437 family)
VNGQPAPLLYISPTQINFQIPFEAIGLLDSGNMEIVVYDNSTALAYVNPNPTANQVSPVIYLVTNQDGTTNSTANPCVRPACTSVTAYGIGQGYLYSLSGSDTPAAVQTGSRTSSSSPVMLPPPPIGVC